MSLQAWEGLQKQINGPISSETGQVPHEGEWDHYFFNNFSINHGSDSKILLYDSKSIPHFKLTEGKDH